MESESGEIVKTTWIKIIDFSDDASPRVVYELSTTDYAGPVDQMKQTGAQKAADKTNVAKGQAGLAAGQQLQSMGAGIQQNQLLPAYSDILKNPGYSSADKNAMTLNTIGGIGATAGASRDALARRAGSTGNPAGFTAGLGMLNRDQMTSAANAEAGLQGKFADTALSERDKALGGLSNLSGVDVSTAQRYLEPGKMEPNQPGFWQNFLFNAKQNMEKLGSAGAGG